MAKALLCHLVLVSEMEEQSLASCRHLFTEEGWQLL